jgi:hypothetical protein
MAYVSFACANPQLFSLMFKLSGITTDGTTKGLSKTGRDPYQILTDAWARYVGNDVPDTISPFALWSTVHGTADLLIKGLGPNSDAQKTALIEETCRTIIDGCIARRPV